MNKAKYIGVDVHSSTCSLCVIDSQGVELDNRTIVTNGRLLIDYFKSLGKDLIVTCEECDLSGWFFEIVHKHVREVIICHPAANREYKRAKTDQLDAHHLAQLLRGGFLHPVFHDGSGREKFRILISNYEDTVQELVRAKNRLASMKRRDRLFDSKNQVHQTQFIIEQWDQQIKSLTLVQEKYQQEIKTSVKVFKEQRYLMSIPGIGPIQSAKIIAQVIDPQRFKNKYKFFAYCGLVRHARISNQRHYGATYLWGNRMLKCAFKMAAHSALTGKNALRTYYDYLRKKGVCADDARNAVARKIAALTLSLWKNKQFFREQEILKSLPAED